MAARKKVDIEQVTVTKVELTEAKECITSCVKVTVSNAVMIGYHLYRIKEKELWRESKAVGFIDYCQQELGMCKRTVYKYIKLCLECSAGSKPSEYLDKKYQGYTVSQLMELLELDEEQQAAITPEDSKRKIREFKKKEFPADIATLLYHQFIAELQDKTTARQIGDYFHDNFGKCYACNSAMAGVGMSFEPSCLYIGYCNNEPAKKYTYTMLGNAILKARQFMEAPGDPAEQSEQEQLIEAHQEASVSLKDKVEAPRKMIYSSFSKGSVTFQEWYDHAQDKQKDLYDTLYDMGKRKTRMDYVTELISFIEAQVEEYKEYLLESSGITYEYEQQSFAGEK